jgi:ribulose-phosphate 3-epimerase
MLHQVKIAPSILSADFTRLGEQVEAAIAAGVSYIHVDVMDGHFVPNLTIGPLVVSALKPITARTGVIQDVHLMIEKPERMIPAFVEAGADLLTVQVEACTHLHRTVQMIKEAGVKAGVALNPATPLVAIEEILPELNLVLIMSVNPGFGGQVYIPWSTARIARLRQMMVSRGLENIELQVDGGIKSSNAAEVAGAGATVLVVGSAVFNSRASVSANISELQRALEQAR